MNIFKAENNLSFDVNKNRLDEKNNNDKKNDFKDDSSHESFFDLDAFKQKENKNENENYVNNLFNYNMLLNKKRKKELT